MMILKKSSISDLKQSMFNRHELTDRGAANLITHSRKVPNSVRRPEDKRKKAREVKMGRQEEEKIKRQEDLKRLKNLKKEEIMEKLRKIHGMAGVSLDEIPSFREEDADLPGPFDEKDLEGDFDPDQYDSKMSQVFGDQYYEKEEVCPIFYSILEKVACQATIWR
jgi:protein KRI1